MRYLIALLMMTTAANAQTACGADILEFADYSIAPIDDRTNEMETTFVSRAKKPIRMIDASAGYRDALGGQIASFALDRDISVLPGETFTQTGRWGPFTFERLLGLRKDEVEKFVCVRAVLYEDGTKEAFD